MCAKKLSDVEELVKKLTEKHQSKYTVEQMNTWAHMIHMGKHKSLDEPPSVPYFKKPKKVSESNGQLYMRKRSQLKATLLCALQVSE